MSTDRGTLEQLRDQALRDLVDLERQVAEQEIPDDVAEMLRRRYELTAARAIDALAEDGERRVAARPPRRAPARIIAYLVAAVAALFAALVLLPQYVATRPDGGFVTGNEVVQSPSATARPPRDLSTVTEAEMEAVIAANPKVLGMRLALVDRYLEKEQHDKAAEHLGVALKQDPGNPDVQARSGWLLFKMGETDAALRFIDHALEIDPSSRDALWFKANILLKGRKDPVGALEVLRDLARRVDLPADLRGQVTRMITAAERAAGR